jgi:hypothetical protein
MYRGDDDEIDGMDIEQLKAKLRRAMGHRRQWDTRHSAARDENILHCVCSKPTPTSDGVWLRLIGTVQCARCGRAIFAEGVPVRT